LTIGKARGIVTAVVGIKPNHIQHEPCKWEICPTD
jgi:hypothetical protein